MSDFDPDYWGARIRAAAQVVPKGEAVMPVMAQVPKDSPLMIAWESHKQTEEYANAKMWASYPQHVDGSLWALFEAGWRAAHLTQPAQAVDVGKAAKCPDCNGHGQARVVVATTPGSFLSPPEDHYDIDVCPTCDGSGESNTAQISHEALVAAYEAVHRSCLTRDVKTPETKARIVRDALTAALPNANGEEDTDAAR